MSGFSLGPVQIGDGLKVIGVLDKVYPLAYLDQLHREGLTLLEVRLDLFEGPLKEVLDYIQGVHRLGRFGLLGTLRETSENVFIRYGMFERFLPCVDMVDIEVDSPIRQEVVALARSLGKRVMVSEHRFDAVPSEAELAAIFAAAKALGPDLVKVAATANSRDELVRLLSFCHARCGELPVSVLAMGPIGKASRLIGGVFGSALTYGYLGQSPVAPGQLSAQALLLFLKQFERVTS